MNGYVLLRSAVGLFLPVYALFTLPAMVSGMGMETEACAWIFIAGTLLVSVWIALGSRALNVGTGGVALWAASIAGFASFTL